MKLPEYAKKFISDKYRYRVLHGGRGSAKSQTIASLLLLYGAQRKIRILCLREVMMSIADSSHKLLRDIIDEEPALSNHYEVTQNVIRGKNGTEFIFKGLRHNTTEIKGAQGIDYAWVEEAANVSENSWQILIPTIRQNDSEIWVSFNIEDEDSSTYRRFIQSPPDSALVMRVNYDDNPFFPDVLREEMENDRARDYGLYLHIWEGEPKRLTDAQVFNNWKVEEFTLDDDSEFLFGNDWGFSTDPNAVVRCCLKDKKLFIDYEAFGRKTEIDDLPELIKSVPRADKHTIRADNARPELIAKMRKEGLDVVPAMKWQGSIEDGVAFLSGFDIIIHPRCKNIAKEFSKYQYKTHRLTGDVLPQIIDDYNHGIDAIRYALEPIIRAARRPQTKRTTVRPIPTVSVFARR